MFISLNSKSLENDAIIIRIHSNKFQQKRLIGNNKQTKGKQTAQKQTDKEKIISLNII